jgi:Tfp pilus assembly protein PilO
MGMPLRDKTSFYTRMQCVLAGMLLVFGGVFFLFTLKPTQRQTEWLQRRLEQAQSELDTARSRAADLPRIAAENEALSLKLAQAKRLPRQQEWAEFVRDITRLGNQFSLRKFTYRYGLAKRSEAFSHVPIVLEFEGDMLNVYSFLKQIEDLPRLTRLRGVTFKSGGGGERNGIVTVQMSLNTYFTNENSNSPFEAPATGGGAGGFPTDAVTATPQGTFPR